MGMDDTDTEMRYVCSLCGYTQTNLELVITHIDEDHQEEGHVIENMVHKDDIGIRGVLGRIAERFR
jgi:hypothetical protein